MPRTAIMADSNCGIMPEEESHYGIHILPMPIIIDGKTYFEGIDITMEEFYQKQTSGSVITTSQPSPGDVTDMWDRLLKAHDEIVFIPMSSGLSNTCQTALLLAEDELYKGRVFVVDNHRISVTQALAVLDAKVLADEGRIVREIKEILEQEAMDATIYIAVDTLEYLKKGGRITAGYGGARYNPQTKTRPDDPGRQTGFLRKSPRNEIRFPRHAGSSKIRYCFQTLPPAGKRAFKNRHCQYNDGSG